MSGTKKDDKQTIQQKKEHAKLLYLDGVTVGKELAARVGVSVQTISKWINDNDREWERMRESKLITKEVELGRMYMQLTELNDHIMNKEVGQRFANSKEADTIMKLTASIRQMETDTSLAEIMEVLKNFLGHVRKSSDQDTVKLFTKKADEFVKSQLR